MDDPYWRDAVSNGNPDEQALIRRWWHHQGGGGLLVWEYYLAGCYLDAVWFPEHPTAAGEQPGTRTAAKFPIEGRSVVLCEAKIRLTPELIGQALVYKTFAEKAGANVTRTVIFAREGRTELRIAAEKLGLEVVLLDT
jgi:hypothetical protein